jgi:hypothetical protein
MLKLKTHSGFHDLFRFWYVKEYKYGMQTFNSSLSSRRKNTIYYNITSFFRIVNKRAIYRLGVISLTYAPVHLTDFSVVNVHVDELSSARIWQHKLCATLSANGLARQDIFLSFLDILLFHKGDFIMLRHNYFIMIFGICWIMSIL